MRPIFSIVIVLAFCMSLVVAGVAADDKTLQNVKGDVTYQTAGVSKTLAPSAQISLANNDYAITGDKSLAAILLPDSTKVLVGSQTRVQLAFFDRQPNITTAQFVLYNGKTRFIVEHPAGSKANYTFQTDVATIGVRGTEGDISISTTALQVNVYALSDPTAPVVVTLKDGRVFDLYAGQSLTVTIAGATLTPSQVSPILATSSDSMHAFCDFGGPGSNAAAATAETNACSTAPAPMWPIAAGGAILAGGLIAALSNHTATSGPTPTTKPAPTPTPTPSPSPTPTKRPTPTPPPALSPTPVGSLVCMHPGTTTLNPNDPDAHKPGDHHMPAVPTAPPAPNCAPTATPHGQK